MTRQYRAAGGQVTPPSDVEVWRKRGDGPWELLTPRVQPQRLTRRDVIRLWVDQFLSALRGRP
jgi:hypothetical protein